MGEGVCWSGQSVRTGEGRKRMTEEIRKMPEPGKVLIGTVQKRKNDRILYGRLLQKGAERPPMNRCWSRESVPY